MPLHAAAERVPPAVLQLLLRAGAVVDAVTATGCAPLLLAARQGHLAVVDLLLQVLCVTYLTAYKLCRSVPPKCPGCSTVTLEKPRSRSSDTSSDTRPSMSCTSMVTCCIRGQCCR